MNAHAIRSANPTDLPAVLGLLEECGLPTDDLTNLRNFLVAETDDKQLVGAVGLDRTGSKGVLRSLAVAPQWRCRGIGKQLVAHYETKALIAGVSEVYLLTTTAGDFFRGIGYQSLSRATVPAEIAAHDEFRGRCPAAACLGKRV